MGEIDGQSEETQKAFKEVTGQAWERSDSQGLEEYFCEGRGFKMRKLWYLCLEI
jgi:hypothetical protein